MLANAIGRRPKKSNEEAKVEAKSEESVANKLKRP